MNLLVYLWGRKLTQDFDDLLLRTCTLLRLHPHVISNIQHVLIDEFQDTNTVQYTLMRLFAQHCKAISIVGDPDQGIYGWRSANAGNLKQMRQDYKDVLVVNLEENYRSSHWILKVSLAVIEQDSARVAKTLLGTKTWGMQPVLRTLADVHLEARWIAREIRRIIGLTGGMIKEKDIAVLVRTASLTRPIEAAFASASLRYRMVHESVSCTNSRWEGENFSTARK
jgi:DNA helicase II / ATP-dependent DNA helicase PcrA